MASPAWRTTRSSSGPCCSRWSSPSAGREVEYNRWYEHDHFYSGCMVGEWQFAGDRFVATKRLKALRYPTADRHDARPVDRFVPRDLLGARGQARRVEPVGGRAGHWLHANGRMFEARTHVHTLLYEKRWAHRAQPTTACTIELALDHNYPGLVVVAGDVKDGHTHDEVDAWFRDTYLPDACARVVGSRCRARRDDAAAARRPSGRRAAARGRSRTGSSSCTSSTTIPRRAGPTATRRSDRRSTTAASPRTCGRDRSSRPTSAPTGTPTSSGSHLERDDAVAGDPAVGDGRARRTTGAAACGVASVSRD